jgi:hypothetical protein
MRLAPAICFVAGLGMAAVALVVLSSGFNGDFYDCPRWAAVLAAICAPLGIVVSVIGLIASLSELRTAWTKFLWASCNVLSGVLCLLLAPFAFASLGA